MRSHEIKIFLQNTEIKYLVYKKFIHNKSCDELTAKLQLISGFPNYFFAEYTVLYTLYSVRQGLKSILIRKITGVAINITMACPD